MALPTSQASFIDSVRYVPLSYDHTDSEPSALRLVYTLFPEWADGQGEVELVRFTEGITNTLLKIGIRRPGASEEQVDSEAVLLRAYGTGTDVLIDRERECASHALLSQHHLAPPLLARFQNGLLYKFMRGQVCTSKDLTRAPIWRGVARRLGEWHAVLPIEMTSKTENGHRSNGFLGDHAHSDPSSQCQLNGHEDADKSRRLRMAAVSRSEPNLWSVMQCWVHALPSSSESERQRNIILRKELVRIIDELGDSLGPGQNGLVFAHCDLLCGNVIVQPHKDRAATTDEIETVSFIDYEYAIPSPAAFDISNFFAEWGGFDCDYTVLPTISERRSFLCDYVRSFNHHVDASVRVPADADQLFKQVDDFRGLPGFYWGIWALIQATISQIAFDYAAYAEVRLSEYWAWRAERDGSRLSSGKEMPLRERRWAQEA